MIIGRPARLLREAADNSVQVFTQYFATTGPPQSKW
jgi:hypothetical protein